MTIPTVRALSFYKKERGGGQAHSFVADDGQTYVTKFSNDPQGRRILVNELIGSFVLQALGVATPSIALVRVDHEFLGTHREVCIVRGGHCIEFEPGIHFGSAYPVDPLRTALHDFLPDTLTSGVLNRDDFLGALVFDKWLGNTDGRQAMFYQPREPRGFLATMVDQGHILNANSWEFLDFPMQGLFPRRIFYESVISLSCFEPWFEKVRAIPDSFFQTLIRIVPDEWYGERGDRKRLEELFYQLQRRKSLLPRLIGEAHASRINPFPNWPL